MWPSQTPVGIEPNRPSVAGLYAGVLGGKGHCIGDRVVMAKVLDAVPEAADNARGNRRSVVPDQRMRRVGWTRICVSLGP